jgi:hypothetical protein
MPKTFELANESESRGTGEFFRDEPRDSLIVPGKQFSTSQRNFSNLTAKTAQRDILTE